LNLKIFKDGKQVLGFEKIGRNNIASLDNGEKIKTGDLGRIEIECSLCGKKNEINFRRGLFKKEYICQTCNMSGEKNTFYGKTHTDEFKDRLSKYMKGRFIGELNPFYGKTHTEETIQILREKCGRKGELNSFYGKTHTEETIQRLSEISKNYYKNISEEEKLKRSNNLKKLQQMIKDRDPEHYVNIRKKAAQASLISQDRYTMNKPEELINKILQEYFTEMEFEYSVILDFKQFDFGSKKHRILIQHQGDYWHGNPMFYGEGKKPLNKIQQTNIMADIDKKEFAEKHNFKLILIWEYELADLPTLIERLRNEF